MSEQDKQGKGKPERGPGFTRKPGGKTPFKQAGRPSGRPFGRPAPRQERGENRPGPRQYGRPAPAGDKKDADPGQRKFGRPAPSSERADARPAPRQYGRPAPSSERADARPAPRQYGRPTPSSERADTRPAPRQYGRPAPSSERSDARPAPRQYGRPAPSSERADARPAPRQYGRPAPVDRREGQGQAKRAERGFVPRPSGFPRKDGPRPPRSGFQPAPAFVKPAPPPKPETILSKDARTAALLVLNRVLHEGAYASLSLDEVFQNMRLSPQDKRLAAVIVYKTVEDLLKIDFALGQYLQDPEALNGKVRNILRLSACQILLMDKIPDFAAVNEAVELTRASGLEDMTGLVNGVLRSLIRGKDSLPWPGPEDEQYTSVMYSIPKWLADVILAAYPEETARQIIAYRNPSHATTLRRNQVLVSPAEFEALLAKKVSWEVSPGELPGVVRVKGASDIGKDLDFLGGRFSIQGEGSMLAVLALAPGAGATVLDCCAAPGGKTMYAAELMQNTGRVHAWDVHEHRVDLIYAQAERLRLYNIRPAVRDATVYQERFEQTMDLVLLDAPCSGSGVMDNKPDIKYRLTPEGLEHLAALQSKLLDVNARYVKPGGVLVYATCSLLPQENEEQIKLFLSAHPEFSLDELPLDFPERFRPLYGEHGLQLLPHRDGVEGFFIARMKRA